MEIEIEERDQQAQVMTKVSPEVEKATPAMEHYKVLEGGGGGGGDPTRLMDDDGGIMLDLDGDDLLFSDDTFPSLPDFPCISSPPATPSAASTNMHAKKGLLSSASSASSSSSSASWSFLHVPDAGAVDMQQQQQPQPVAVSSAIDEIMMLAQPSLSSTSDHNHQSGGDGGEFSEVGLDILGDIDLFDVTADPWDPCSIFPGEDVNMDAAAVDEQGEAGKGGDFLGEGRLHSGVAGEGAGDKIRAVQQEEEEEEVEENNSSEDLAKVFLDWLKSNKDMISPEDLRSIKLKRSTIECAARRLGGGKQGRMQLLKLILTWVQANHLHGKRRRGRPATPGEAAAPLSFHYQHHQQPFPVNPNLNHFEYHYGGAAAGVESSSNNLAPRCNSWIPYSMDPSNGAMMTAYGSVGGGGGGGEMMYQTAAAPYPYHCSASGVMVKPQQFSSASPDFHSPDHGVGAWPPQFAAPAPSFAPFSGVASSCPAPMAMAPPPYPGAFPNQFPGAHPMYNQGQRLTGMASATKEARKKRMARQRRFSSLHHQRSQNQHQLPHVHQPASDGAAAAAAAAAAAVAGATSSANPRNWGFWTHMSAPSSHQMNSMANAAPPPLPASALPLQHQQQQQHNTQRVNIAASASNSEKRQGWKSSEKNLKFLLQKVLKQSDVGSLGRIVLPKKEAEIHLPELDARDGISIQMEDIGTSRVWNMRYRYWPNNKSRMYLLENTGDFVRSNGLQEGDFIVIYSDVKCGKYMIRGVKVHQQMEARRANNRNAAGRAQKKRCCSERTSAGFRENEEVEDDEDEEEGDEASPSSMGKMNHSP